MPCSEPAALSIWIVNPSEDTPGEGLPPRRYWSLARVLAGRGHDVTWWTGSWSQRRKAVRTTTFRACEDEGFAVKRVAVRPYARDASLSRLASQRDFGRTLERVAGESVASGQLERPDVILASLPPLEGSEAACRLARRLDAALVVDVTDAWPETGVRLLPGPAWLRETLRPLLFGRLEARRRAVLEAADAVSAATHAVLETIGTAVGGKPTHVCHAGVWLAEFAPPPRVIDEVAAPMDAGERPRDRSVASLACVYAGPLDKGRDLGAVAAAARQLSAEGVAATIHVAGTGRLEPMLRKAAQSIHGSCSLRMHGLLDRGSTVRLLSSCEVGLVLVKPESLVALPDEACDYAAAGLALVNPLPGELERFIADYRAGVAYTAGSGESLARSIASLAGGPRQLLEMRHGARRLAEVAFDRERTYGRFADWIESMSGANAETPSAA